MNHRKALSYTILPVALALGSCSGLPNKCTTNCNGNATVSFTLVADTLPANPSIISFKVSVASVQIKPATGATITLTPATPTIDLMRLQSDTAFLGTLANVPAGTYTVQVSLSTPATGSTIAFFNDTGAMLKAGSTTCAINTVCNAALTVNGSPTIASFTVTVAANVNQGIELDFNLANAISLSNGTLSVNFTPSAPSPGVLTAFTLPRTNANLGSNQIELIEDFTGVVSLNGNNVTVTSNSSPSRGVITAVENSNSFFDASPDGTTCQTPTTFAQCVKSGQIASVDAFLNSDGTLALKKFEPLLATQKDLVEGIVYAVSGTVQQFGIVVTDKTQAASGSLIGSVNTGDLLTVNLATSPPLQPFFVDQKGLSVSNNGEFTNFSGQTTVSAIHQGQTISVHVTNFTPVSGTIPASVIVDTVTLRWSRLIAPLTGAASPGQINVNTVPSYFALNSVFPTQIFTGSLGADGVTNLDGIPFGGTPNASPPPVALRVLYLQNINNSAAIPFFAAKVRQH